MFEYQSSPIDWCEPNYRITYFIAEFYNTISAIPMVYVAYLLWVPKHKTYACIVMGIGIGTIIFHGTLNLFGQLFDEFCLVLYIIHLSFQTTPYLALPLIFLIFIYPEINAYMLIMTALFIIVAWYNNVIVLRIPLKKVTNSYHFRGPNTVIFLCLFAGIIWIIDIACINGIHFHFVWHIISAYILYMTCGMTIKLNNRNTSDQWMYH